ncbi:MAG TPA: tetratricopeptide repeat protein [Polyangiaceae bacterium]
MSPLRCAAMGVLAASVFVAPCARADAESDAKDLFERGRELRAAGNCAAAAPLFEKAYEIYPSGLGTLRNAAECEEQLGKWATARRSWLELKRALLFAHDAKYGGWQSDADGAAARLAPRVSHLTIEVTGGSEAPSVTVDGEPIKPELVGTALDRDPGHYAIVAHIGVREARATVDLVTGESQTVRLDFTAPLGEAKVSVHATPKAHASSSPWMPAGWVTLAIGVAALAGMGVAIGVRQDALSTVESQCTKEFVCPDSLRGTVDRGNAASTAATALAIAGSVLAGAGMILLVVGIATPSHEVAFHVSPFGASLEGRF